MTEVGNQRNGREEVLQVLLAGGVCIGPLHKLVRGAELLVQALGALVDRLAVDAVPQRLLPVVNLQIDHVDVVPHLHHLLQLLVALLQDCLGRLDELRELEDARVAREIREVRVVLEQLLARGADAGVGRIDASGVVEERLLGELERVRLDAVLEGLDVVLDLERLALLDV
eukprot:2970224-Rhodomonas_salina.1